MLGECLRNRIEKVRTTYDKILDKNFAGIWKSVNEQLVTNVWNWVFVKTHIEIWCVIRPYTKIYQEN